MSAWLQKIGCVGKYPPRNKVIWSRPGFQTFGVLAENLSNLLAIIRWSAGGAERANFKIFPIGIFELAENLQLSSFRTTVSMTMGLSTTIRRVETSESFITTAGFLAMVLLTAKVKAGRILVRWLPRWVLVCFLLVTVAYLATTFALKEIYYHFIRSSFMDTPCMQLTSSGSLPDLFTMSCRYKKLSNLAATDFLEITFLRMAYTKFPIWSIKRSNR